LEIDYEPVASTSALQRSELNDVDFAVFERPLPAAAYPNSTHAPLAGGIMVVAYNVPELSGAETCNLILDRDVLAAIWSGNVSRWNDPAIRLLNPSLAARLPDRNITLGFADDCDLSSCDVAKRALASFSRAFAVELEDRGGLFANMRFAVEGRGQRLTNSSQERAEWLKKEPYGLTFLDHGDAIRAGPDGVRVTALYNKAGALVEPSVESVQLAMSDFADAYAAGDLTVDIHDAPGNGSWPLAYMLFVAITGPFTGEGGCGRLEQLQMFFGWAHTRKGHGALYEDRVEGSQLASLDKELPGVDAPSAVSCTGVRENPSSLIGFGAPLIPMIDLADHWNNPTNWLRRSSPFPTMRRRP
jgi:ABC-type phosphate transport system substrate-binding protein